VTFKDYKPQSCNGTLIESRVMLAVSNKAITDNRLCHFSFVCLSHYNMVEQMELVSRMEATDGS